MTKSSPLGRRSVLALAGGGLLASPAVVRAQGRSSGVALVIGNSKYQWEAALPNVRRDVADVARRFRDLGLQTELVEDANRDALHRAFAAFQSACRGANFAAFYYAGHGATWGRDAYFVPVDADLSTPSTVQTLVPFSAINPMIKEARNKLYVFDSCRNNPADGWRQVQAERAAIITRDMASGGRNFLTLSSTSPGRVALDGPAGQNSPFAAAFLRHLTDPSVDLQSLPSRLRRDVLVATQGRQVLWDRNAFDAPFAIGGNPRPGPSAASGDPSRIIELPNAYAYARENNLPLPSGLIAWRPAGTSPDSWKAGSFRLERKSPLGAIPMLLIVLAVEGSNTAKVIVANRGQFNEKKNVLEEGAIWRLIDAKVSGSVLEYAPRIDEERFMFNWRDSNSGSFTSVRYNAGGTGQAGGPQSSPSSPFTRLDG